MRLRAATTEDDAEPIEGLELSAEYRAEASAYAKVRAHYRELQADAAGALAVATLGKLAREDRDHIHTAQLHEKAERFLAGRSLTPRELDQAIERTDEEVVAHGPIIAAAKDRFGAARERELVRLANRLLPAHRAAVVQLAHALSAMSHAIETERAVRARLEAFGIGPAPAILPDCSTELNIGTFDQYSSRASEWRRKMFITGVLA